MEENESLEYSCSKCNSVVSENDKVCSNCGADLTEIILENSEANNELPKFIKVVAIIFLIFNSLKLLNNTFKISGGIAFLFSDGTGFEYDGQKFSFSQFHDLTIATLFILMAIDWIPTVLLFISSIGLLTRKKWSLKLTIKSLYFTIFVNILFIIGSSIMYTQATESEFLGIALPILLIYFIIQSLIYYFITRGLSSERFKYFPSISIA